MKYLKVVILVVICAALLLGYYYYLSNHTGRSKKTQEESQLTEVEDLLTTDLESDYPPTPREVVKYYNRIIKCYYGEEYTEEQLEQLVAQQRMLLDEELLEQNPEDVFLETVKADIEEYRLNERKISDYTVSSSNDITYKEVEGRQCAYVTTSYFMQEGNSYQKSYQEYVLRQDEEGQWKITAFQLTTAPGTEE
jgi:Na+-transporting NADH:ubiquinone oxidoreductase subunit NqrC